ncbi:hypothetical protein ELI54_04025 [Rhizobium ruizarguesonis]|nr:hypothetical protein ELI56_04040 [Rhizobium ruizarguesonis]TAT87447.1 hypothetical protein ELI54_04025 [Rhizobium ruizarguesonis]TAU04142.1 hypothetical protein ELI55_04100 [Rhizobium ruizarguesonis]TAY78177.1 hypothetical protein ELH86_03865 [Rhizobium ruizarguesonis]TAZ33688.1 hypothetical protein ELH80_04050 [Rhizobium ruizarguesonis]
MRHIPFAPFTGRRWRQPDEGQVSAISSAADIASHNNPCPLIGVQGYRICRTVSRPFASAQGVRRCNRFTGSIAAACGGTAAHPPAIPSSSASSAFR